MANKMLDLNPHKAKVVRLCGPYGISNKPAAWCYYNEKTTDVHAEVVVAGSLYQIVLSVPVRRPASRKKNGGRDAKR